MLRGILVGLDGSAYSAAAVELGIRWARRFEARVVGIAVVDEPGIIAPEATPMGASYFRGEGDQARLDEARQRAATCLEQLTRRCAEAGVACQALQVEGDPVEEIALHSQCYDVILLGQKTYFRTGDPSQADSCLEELLHQPPRPVVAVPDVLPAGEAIVIAYDGSVQSARALAGFHGTGIGQRYPIHVITLGNSIEAAEAIAKRAVDYLTLHGVEVTAHPLVSGGHPGPQLAHEAEQLGAQLLVMGAFSHSPLHEFFFGSTTRTVLKATALPVFLDH